MEAAVVSNAEAIKLLIEAGADVNASNQVSCTVVQCKVLQNHLD